MIQQPEIAAGRQTIPRRLPVVFGTWLPLSFVLWLPLARSADAEVPILPTANRWTEVDALTTKSKAFCATVYMSATDEFLLWGLPHERFEVETFSVKTGSWQDAWPAGNLPAFPEKGWRESTSIHGQGLPNCVEFISQNGIQRPSRAPTFHQVTYDTRRDRVLFFVGGQTFSYNPKTRRWTDLQPAKSPTACGSLVWASLCYDPVNDEAVLFGGGMALNPWGGAYTWLYDCEENTWRPLDQPRNEQPPLRCKVQTAFDAANNCIVLFGGDTQSQLLADTWIYDVKTRRWTERKPELSPPPVASCGMTYVASRGVILVCSGDDQTWTHDAAANKWTRITGGLGLDGREDKPGWSTGFLSCAYSTKDDVAVLVGMGPLERHNIRRTWLYRLDPATAKHEEQNGVEPGTSRYRLDEWPRLKTAPPPDREANRKRLEELPANTMVEAKPPATVTAKTWSTATIDTHRGEVIYTGGGHSGYSGNDWAHYNVADNRWSMSWPPKVAPYLWACSVGPYGWSYGAQPWSTHTRHTYRYDPQSRMCVYLGREHTRMDGQEVLLGEDRDDAFRHSASKHGCWQWVYEPEKKEMLPPHFGSPWGHSDKLYGFTGSSHGLYMTVQVGKSPRLYHGNVENGKCKWKLINEDVPPLSGDYEIHPLIYDSKRDRLLQFYGTGELAHPSRREPKVVVYAYPFKSRQWEKLDTTGYATISRDIVYNSKHDTVMLLSKRQWLVLDCRTNHWRALDCPMPEGNYGWDSALVYDPVHDLAVSLLPTRFSGPMRVFLFRYDPATATFKDPAARTGGPH